MPNTPATAGGDPDGRSGQGDTGGNRGDRDGRWRRAASLAELRSRGSIRVEVSGHDVLVVRDGKEIYACGNVCAHQHFAMLHAGAIAGRMVTCPMHGWTYDVATGRCTSGEGRIPVYEVMVRGDDVFVGADAWA